jgi:elongation factor P hydroxylase
MLSLNSYIKITNPITGKLLEFNFVNKVEIESSWKQLTDTARITLPRAINILGGNINEVVARGSKVIIELGYDGDLKREFTGYVTRVDAKIPITIECEDEMFLLKNTAFTKSFKNVSLKDIIKYIYPGRAKVADISFGYYYIKNKASAALVLSDLRQNFGVVSYFKYELQGAEYVPVLYAGFPYDFKLSERVTYHFQRNIIDSNLQYRLKEDIKLLVKGISIQPDNKKIEIEVGDKDGEQRTLNYYAINKDALKRIITKEIDKLKVDGYRGDFETFGIPFVQHNYIADMQDSEYVDRPGQYLIDGVKTEFGISGFRRNIKLGTKI